MDDTELANRICAELRRLSVNGVAPSAQRYDQQRDRALPRNSMLYARTGYTWAELIERSGLAPSPRARLRPRRGVPAAVERDIERTMRANRALDSERYTDGLTALDSSRRVREFTVQMPDGSVRRVVQEIVSLR